MKINVDPKNERKIQALLDEVNGSAHEHTATVADILKSAEDMTARMDAARLLESYRSGARMHFRSGQPVGKAYRRSRRGTAWTIEVFPSGIFLTSVAEDTLWPQDGGSRTLQLTEPQQLAVSTNFLYRVRTGEGLR